MIGEDAVIGSVLDTDLYKLTMAQAALKLFPKAQARYSFINRDLGRKFTPARLARFKTAVNEMANLHLLPAERTFLEKNCPYLEPWFLSWLTEYRFKPFQVQASLGGELEDELVIDVGGNWAQAILWEVPLLATISELFFDHLRFAPEDIGPPTGLGLPMKEVVDRAHQKMISLRDNNCMFADFGTRRRFSARVHHRVLQELKMTDRCVGTSNVQLAMALGLKPIGTYAHEWVQAVSALMGLRYANRYAMEAWHEVYKGCLGIALTDTFGSEAFFRDFNMTLSKLFDGVRHDSGDPCEFATRTVAHYKSLGIDHSSKTIIFSDSLNVEKAVALKKHCDKLGIRCAFGIGTNFTNDVPGVKPLNMVIKLREIDGIEVVKLSDSPGKTIGSKEAVDVVKWTFQKDLSA